MSAQSDASVREESDAARISEFLRGVRLLSGCCFCSNQSVRSGEHLVHEYLALLSSEGDGVDLNLSLPQCAAVLDWLSSVEPHPDSPCFACSEGAAPVGKNLILSWVAHEILRNHKDRTGAPS